MGGIGSQGNPTLRLPVRGTNVGGIAVNARADKLTATAPAVEQGRGCGERRLPGGEVAGGAVILHPLQITRQFPFRPQMPQEFLMWTHLTTPARPRRHLRFRTSDATLSHPTEFFLSLVARTVFALGSPPMIRPLIVSALFGFAASLTPAASSPASNAADFAFFESKVRPLLIERCYECHSDKKQKGGLRLDSQPGWQAGGDTGTVIVPGDPAKSLLIEAIGRKNEDLQMPPKEALSAAEVALLTEWIQRGAPDPRTTAPAPSAPKIVPMTLAQARTHWSFQPITAPALPSSVSPSLPPSFSVAPPLSFSVAPPLSFSRSLRPPHRPLHPRPPPRRKAHTPSSRRSAHACPPHLRHAPRPPAVLRSRRGLRRRPDPRRLRHPRRPTPRPPRIRPALGPPLARRRALLRHHGKIHRRRAPHSVRPHLPRLRHRVLQQRPPFQPFRPRTDRRRPPARRGETRSARARIPDRRPPFRGQPRGTATHPRRPH